MPRKNLLKLYVNDVKKFTKLNGFFAGFKYAISEIRLYNRIKEEIVRTFKKFPHKIIMPSLFEISVKSKIISAAPLEILNSIINTTPTTTHTTPSAISSPLDLLKTDCANAIEEYNNLLKNRGINTVSDVSNVAIFLYYIVRIKKPELMIETGVATGLSSFFILKAMSENNFGKLVSTDIRYDAGEIVPDYLRNRWNFILLKRDNKNQFKKFINGFDKIDIFFHDSDHSYWWQNLEYVYSFEHIKKGGLLVSDDIDNSYAFLDFVKKNKLAFYSFFNVGSMAGVIIK